jgi:hypothetical protein
VSYAKCTKKRDPFLKKTKGVVNVTILKDLALLVKATGEEKEKIKLKNQKKGGSILVAQVDQF